MRIRDYGELTAVAEPAWPVIEQLAAAEVPEGSRVRIRTANR